MRAEGFPQHSRLQPSQGARARSPVLAAAWLLACAAGATVGILMEADSVALPATVSGQTSFYSVTFLAILGISILALARRRATLNRRRTPR